MAHSTADISHHDAAGAGRPRRGIRPGTSMTLLFFAAIFGVPMLAFWGREELRLWQFAAAARATSHQATESRLVEMSKIAERMPDNVAVQQVLANSLIGMQQYARAVDVAAALYARSAERFQTNGHSPDEYLASGLLYVRTLNAAGNRTGGLVELEQVDLELQRRDFLQPGQMANDLAYQSALANSRLVHHLDPLKGYFQDIQNSQPFGKVDALTMPCRVALAAALMSLHTGQVKLILPELSRQIEQHQAVTEELDRAIIRHHLNRNSPLSAPENSLGSGSLHVQDGGSVSVSHPDVKLDSVPLEMLRKQTALLLLVRALCLDQDDQTVSEEQSLRDRFAVRDMGFDEQVLIGELPELRICTENALMGSALLDTRGYVFFRLGEFATALPELDLSCNALVTADQLIAGQLGPSPQDPRDPVKAAGERKQTLATLYLHRAECLRAAGQELAAEADFARIRALGFEPDDPTLF